MILHRILELQAHTVIRKLTDTQEEYEFIESLIESQKPTYPKKEHHYLIQTSFRYSLPVPVHYQARFKPPFSHRNCFYGAEFYRTSAYEYAYHWLRQRVHLEGLSQEAQARTHFTVSFKDAKLFDLRKDPACREVMARKDYAPSHEFMRAHPEITSILYPSCRDPEAAACVVTFEIETLGRKALSEKTLYFVYQAARKACSIQDVLQNEPVLEVSWAQVA